MGHLQTLRELAAVALVSGIATLALTGMWNHHAQVLYLAGVLCLTLVTRQFLNDYAAPSLAGGSLVLLAGLLSGLPSPRADLQLLLSVQQRIGALTVRGPETEALLHESNSGQYARIGMHDDLGHAEGLEDWKLLCPRFHQYPFDPPEAFQEVLSCASQAPYLLVSDSASPRATWGEGWNDFIGRVDALLARAYVCHPYPGGRLCSRRPIE